MAYYLRELREQANVAMFLTGRDNEADKIFGLEIGAVMTTSLFKPSTLVNWLFVHAPL